MPAVDYHVALLLTVASVVLRRFKKLYEDFQPDFRVWKLVLLARKFALACIAIMIDRIPLLQVRTRVLSWLYLCNRNLALCALLQAALGVMVLFTSYVLQQRFSPFIILQDELTATVEKRRRRSAFATLTAAEEEAYRLANRRKAREARAADAAVASPSRRAMARRAKRRRNPRAVAAMAAKWIRHRLDVVMSDYNLLESGFLISAVLILISGMVFASGGFRAGSVPYNMLTTIVTVLILGSVFSFFVLLSVEVYKSFRDASLHDRQRKTEADRVEATMMEQSRGGTPRLRDAAPSVMAPTALQLSRLDRATSLRSARVDQARGGVGGPPGGRPDVASTVLGMYANLPPQSRLAALHGHASAGGSAGPAVRRIMKGRVAVGRQMRGESRDDIGGLARTRTTSDGTSNSAAVSIHDN
jgi:hypothetical protein